MNKNEHWFESSKKEASEAQSLSFITFMAGVFQESAKRVASAYISLCKSSQGP